MRPLEVHPNWENATPEELRVAMEAAPNRRSYIRLQALRALLLGFSRPQVCTLWAITSGKTSSAQSARKPASCSAWWWTGWIPTCSSFFWTTLAETVPKVEGVRQLLVMDNASWHKATRLDKP